MCVCYLFKGYLDKTYPDLSIKQERRQETAYIVSERAYLLVQVLIFLFN